MQETHTCPTCGHPAPKPPVSVSIPASAVALFETFDEDMFETTVAYGRARPRVAYEESNFGYWEGPTLYVEFARPGEDIRAWLKVALDLNPPPGCFDGERQGGRGIPKLADWT